MIAAEHYYDRNDDPKKMDQQNNLSPGWAAGVTGEAKILSDHYNSSRTE